MTGRTRHLPPDTTTPIKTSPLRRCWDCGCTPAPRLRSTAARTVETVLGTSRSVAAAEEDDPTAAQHDQHLTGPEMETRSGIDNVRTSSSASLRPWTQADDSSQLQRLCSRPLQLAAPSTDTRTRPIRGGAQKCAAPARLTIRSEDITRLTTTQLPSPVVS
ncbi:hypothetical protein J6590_051193 [Homalodisca vitripennis]|nr:hypothetical protein J6590_051193 [Homalodisca vitripennis]